jgi:hypothetical protein
MSDPIPSEQRDSGTVQPLVGQQTEHFVCPDCGPHVAVDEDECCAYCGEDCSITKCECQQPNTKHHLATGSGPVVQRGCSCSQGDQP